MANKKRARVKRKTTRIVRNENASNLIGLIALTGAAIILIGMVLTAIFALLLPIII